MKEIERIALGDLALMPRERIVEVRRIPALELRANKKNWRKHPKAQKDALAGVMREVGDVGVLLAYRSERNGGALTLVDGHLRQELLPDHDYMVAIADLSDSEADYVLATHDPIAAMAEASKAELENLLASVKTGEAATSEMLKSLVGAQPDLTTFSGVDTDVRMPGDLSAFQVTSERLRFESSLPYDIPPLRDDLLGDVPDALTTWVGRDYSSKDGGHLYIHRTDSTFGINWKQTALGFYTDDYRWEKEVWDGSADFTSKLFNLKPMAVLTPDFSTYWKLTKAERIYQVYRARWCGRFWQEAGIKIIPSLQFAPGEMDYMLAGIPRKAPCVAMQMQTLAVNDGGGDLRIRLELVRQAVEELKPEKVLVYGTKRAFSALQESGISTNFLFVVSRSEMRKRGMEKLKKKEVSNDG